MGMHMIITSLAPSSLGSYKGSSAEAILGSLRVKVNSSKRLLWYHCLSLTKDVPGHFLASLRWLLTGVLKMIWSCPSFSKMAVKSVERGRLQTGRDPELLVSNHTGSKAQELTGQSLGFGELYSFSLSRFCPNGFSL
ncbi:hypothetical protein YC2023_082243 [Brassica napus]